MSVNGDSLEGCSIEILDSEELDLSHKIPIDSSASDVTAIPCRGETWAVGDIRRHWRLKSHCVLLHFPNQYPNLALPTKLGRYLWQHHRSTLKPNATCMRDILRCATAALNDMVLYETQLDQIIVCDSLMNISWFDAPRRKSFIENLHKFLRMQKNVVMASFENSRMRRMEGTHALLSLGVGCGFTLKYLYLWQMFAQDESPVLRDTTFCQYREKGAFKASASCKLTFWSTLLRFRSLCVLAINYAYLADSQGHTLCMLASVLTHTLRELQVLCHKEDCLSDRQANDFDGGYMIPDAQWYQACTHCPRLRALMVIVTVPRYEDQLCFLSQSVPVSYLHISSGLDGIFVPSHEWHMDCTLNYLFHWYPQTLKVLNIHLWQNHDQLDRLLIIALDKLPLLTALEFIGKLYSLDTICNICHKLDSGKYSMERLCMHVTGLRMSRDVANAPEPADWLHMQQVMDETKEKFRSNFKERGIQVDFKAQQFY